MPKKRLGQHFLSDPGVLERIVKFSRIEEDATVVEIGPGRGSLTTRLAAHARRVIAIELDRDLIPRLRQTMPANVEIVEGDALDLDYAAIAPAPFDVVANLPYNIATPLLDRFIGSRRFIDSVTVLVQKEVADRISALPGSPAYGALSVGIQYYAHVERGFLVPPGAFFPPPKVHSRLIRLTWRPAVDPAPGFAVFVRQAFASRRKKLANNLTAIVPGWNREGAARVLAGIGLPEGVRPERLAVSDFKRLYDAVKSAKVY